MKLGSTIWNLRKAVGKSRRAVAEEAGFSTDSLRRWEKGQQSPRVDELEKVAEVLGVPVDVLLASN